MSSYVRAAATATFTPISTSIGMVKNAYDFLTTSSSDAKDYVKKTVEYLKDGGAAEISGNTLLAAGIGPKLLEVAKTQELEKLTSTVLDVLKDVLSILQSEELTKITTNTLWLIKSKPMVDLLSHITGLTLDALKLMQTQEMSGVRLQLETLINSILGEYVKQKTDKSSAASPDKWVTILLFLEKLVQFHQLTSSEASHCRRLARKQNFELLILFNAYGVAEYNAIIAADGKNIYQDTEIVAEKQQQHQKKKGGDKNKTHTSSHPTSSSNHHTTSPMKPSPSHAHDDFHISPQRSTPMNVQLHHHHGQYATYNPKHYRIHPGFQSFQPDHQRSETTYHGQTYPIHDRSSIHTSDGRYSSEEEVDIYHEYQQQQMYVNSTSSHDNIDSTSSSSQAPTQQTEYQSTSASTFVRYVREMLNEEDTS